MQGPRRGRPFEVLQCARCDGDMSVVGALPHRYDSTWSLCSRLWANVIRRWPERHMGRSTPARRWRASTIAPLFHAQLEFGARPSSPSDKTPQDTIMQPTTIYGICKVTARWGITTTISRCGYPFGVFRALFERHAAGRRYDGLCRGDLLRGCKVGNTCPVPSDVYKGHDLHARCAAGLRRTDGSRPPRSSCTATVSTSRR